MLIIGVLALVLVSVALVTIAVKLRSRSVATLNLLMCFAAAILIQPWSSMTIHPPIDPDLRQDWVATMVWVGLFLSSIIGWIYCFTVTARKKESTGRRRKRRRKRRRSNRDQGQSDDERPDSGEPS